MTITIKPPKGERELLVRVVGTKERPGELLKRENQWERFNTLRELPIGKFEIALQSDQSTNTLLIAETGSIRPIRSFNEGKGAIVGDEKIPPGESGIMDYGISYLSQ